MIIEKGVIHKPAKVVIYGVEGIGKTTLASQFPAPLILDLEDGSSHIDVSRAKIKGWPELMAALDKLQADNMGFKTLVIDSADWAEDFCTAYILARDKKDSVEAYPYGKGYVIVSEEYQRMFSKLNALATKLNIVIVAHAEVKRTELPDDMGSYDRYEPKLSKSNKPLLKEWADALLFAKWKVHIKGKNDDGKGKGIGGRERVLYCQHDAAWDAKNRYGLPMEISMTIEALSSLFASPTISHSVAPSAPAVKQTSATSALQKLKKAMDENNLIDVDVLNFLHSKNITEAKNLSALPEDLLLRCAKNVAQIAEWASRIKASEIENTQTKSER